jgi:hypothetical protein
MIVPVESTEQLEPSMPHSGTERQPQVGLPTHSFGNAWQIEVVHASPAPSHPWIKTLHSGLTYSPASVGSLVELEDEEHRQSSASIKQTTAAYAAIRSS